MKKFFLLMGTILYTILPSFAQTDTLTNVDVEWIVVDESQLDSVSKVYFLNEKLATFANPKIENSGIVTVVVNYLADVFDQILLSLTEKTEQFYGTDLGKITIWSLAFGYVGQEILTHFWVLVFTLFSLVIFTIIARKYMVFRSVRIEYGKIEDDPNESEIEYKFLRIDVLRNLVITVVFVLITWIVNGCVI